jgi:hypothetical protein
MGNAKNCNVAGFAYMRYCIAKSLRVGTWLLLFACTVALLACYVCPVKAWHRSNDGQVLVGRRFDLFEGSATNRGLGVVWQKHEGVPITLRSRWLGDHPRFGIQAYQPPSIQKLEIGSPRRIQYEIVTEVFGVRVARGYSPDVGSPALVNVAVRVPLLLLWSVWGVLLLLAAAPIVVAAAQRRRTKNGDLEYPGKVPARSPSATPSRSARLASRI